MTKSYAEILRFLVAGASTTAISYALYLLLIVLTVPYLVAYPVSFVAGIIWSYFVNSRFVFKHRPTVRGLFAFPLVYVFQLLLGTLIVHIAIARIGIPAWAAPLAAIAVTLPFTYFASRWLIKRTSRPIREEGQGEAP